MFRSTYSKPEGVGQGPGPMSGLGWAIFIGPALDSTQLHYSICHHPTVVCVHAKRVTQIGHVLNLASPSCSISEDSFKTLFEIIEVS
jgi:hypothetical protein